MARTCLSQTAVAKRAGVSQQAVSKWYRGEARPSLGNLHVLAETFGTSPPDKPPAAEGQPTTRDEPLSSPEFRLLLGEGQSPPASSNQNARRAFREKVLEPRMLVNAPLSADEIQFLRDVARTLYGVDLGG